MRRVLVFLLLIALSLGVCSCAPAVPAPTQPPVPVPPPALNPAPQPTEPDNPKPAQPDLPIKLELKLTEEPQPYHPNATITPLVNAPLIYSNCIRGNTTFIRIADQTRIELPHETYSYQPVRDSETNCTIAYALIGDESVDYRMAFMSITGELISDFLYYSFGEDAISFPNRYGYVVVMHQDENGHGAYGLLNLSNGEEIALPEYNTWPEDMVQPQKYALLAEQGGQYQLLDYKGQVLFEFGERPDVAYDERQNAENYEFYAGYTYFPSAGEVYSSTMHYISGSGSHSAAYENERGYVEEYLPYADCYVQTRFEPTYSQQLEDGQGNIIVAFDRYEYVDVFGQFIIGSSAESSNNDFDILNSQGEVLLHRPLGVLKRERATDDFLVVWLNTKTCVFLYPDGSTVPVANPPQVELIYIGG